MIEQKNLRSRSEWLKERGKRIGGSECASIIGQNPYTTNIELWEIKTGRKVSGEISDNPLVQYGSEAEKYLRELFKLDYQQYRVSYTENNIWTNDLYPFAHASLDGWLRDPYERFGVLEIKTATISSAVQKQKWEGRIPNNYFCQVLWYMAITDAEFAEIKAQLKYEYDDLLCITKHYHIERDDVKDEIDFLMKKGREFWEYVESNTCPPLVLPEI